MRNIGGGGVGGWRSRSPGGPVMPPTMSLMKQSNASNTMTLGRGGPKSLVFTGGKVRHEKSLMMISTVAILGKVTIAEGIQRKDSSDHKISAATAKRSRKGEKILEGEKCTEKKKKIAISTSTNLSGGT